MDSSERQKWIDGAFLYAVMLMLWLGARLFDLQLRAEFLACTGFAREARHEFLEAQAARRPAC